MTKSTSREHQYVFMEHTVCIVFTIRLITTIRLEQLRVRSFGSNFFSAQSIIYIILLYYNNMPNAIWFRITLLRCIFFGFIETKRRIRLLFHTTLWSILFS